MQLVHAAWITAVRRASGLLYIHMHSLVISMLLSPA